MRRRFAIGGVLVALIVVIAAIIFGSSKPVMTLRASSLHVLKPVMHAAGGIRRWIGSRKEIFSSRSCRACDETQEALVIAEARIVDAMAKNASLTKALGLKEQFSPSLKAAQVMLYTEDQGRELLLIDVGEEDGIRAGDPVIDEDNLLVGEVAEVGRGFAKVAVASNKGTAFAVAFVPLGDEAFAKGLGARAFSIELIPRNTSVRPGDFIIRVSKNARNTPTIFAGRVVSGVDVGSGAFSRGRATLLAHPERLERVLVLIKP